MTKSTFTGTSTDTKTTSTGIIQTKNNQRQENPPTTATTSTTDTQKNTVIADITKSKPLPLPRGKDNRGASSRQPKSQQPPRQQIKINNPETEEKQIVDPIVNENLINENRFNLAAQCIDRLVRLSESAAEGQELDKKMDEFLLEETQRSRAWTEGMGNIRSLLVVVLQKQILSAESIALINEYLKTPIENADDSENESPLKTLIAKLQPLKKEKTDTEQKELNTEEEENTDFTQTLTDLNKQYDDLVAENNKIRLNIIKNPNYTALENLLLSFDDLSLEALGAPARTILYNTSKRQIYHQLMPHLKSQITRSEKEDTKEISVRLLTDQNNKNDWGKILRSTANPGLAHKVLSDTDITDHVLSRQEAESVIKFLGLENEVYFSSTEPELTNYLKNIKTELDKNINGSWQILFNPTKDKSIPNPHWGLLKISRDTNNYKIEYSDSIYAECSLKMENILQDTFGKKVEIVMNDYVFFFKGPGFMDDGTDNSPDHLYPIAAIKQAVSNTGINHPIGRSEGKNWKPIKRLIFQKVLEAHEFNERDPRLQLEDINERVQRDSQTGSVKFKDEFIEDKLNPPNVELPFFKLIHDSVDELDKYIKEYEESIWYQNNLYKNEYDNFIKDAKAISVKLAGSKNNNDLQKVVNYSLQKNPDNSDTTDINKLIKDLKNSNDSLPALQIILENIISRIDERSKSTLRTYTNQAEGHDKNKLNFNDPETAFNFYFEKLKNVTTDRAVVPSEFSWIGQQHLMELGISVNPEKQTKLDEIIGKLKAILDLDDMDNETKCNEMAIVVEEANREVNNSRYGKPLFGKPFLMFHGSRLGYALAHLHDPEPKPKRENKAVSESGAGKTLAEISQKEGETNKKAIIPKYTEDYMEIWRAGIANKPQNMSADVAGTLALLEDYVNPKGKWIFSGRFLTFHWKREHVETVQKKLEEYKKSPPQRREGHS